MGRANRPFISRLQAIRSGDMDIAIGCGVESMSRVPMFSDGRFSPEFIADFPYGIVHQGISAEMLGRQVGSQP